ncbi:hypothetical protein K0B96_13120 [Horticoccus luteus]|uniref:Uncharacterized protein n=1 Tax=Horticoccus luteus TaxID=2862869 RepID=A0A8F9TUB8_9BACT|nr:hypothetical protein [Horticoccus luteus]QYM78237.1 hypothetical protein K0B96_13120 [Horticoccus luteus]
MTTPEPSDDLSALLHEWQVRPERDPHFRARVWRRLEARRGEASWAGYLRAHARPAVGGLALALLLGAWSGHAAARHHTNAQREAMVKDYVRALDARTMAQGR